jgi:peptidoglycan/LPS O-acetylase OafA/YrhL
MKTGLAFEVEGVPSSRESIPPTSQRMAEAPHLAFLDGVRGVAALYVTVHHIAIHLPLGSDATRLERACRHLLSFGHDAVDVFIVLSGYCLLLPFLRRPLHTVEFLKRRAARILPPYYMALLGSWLLIQVAIGAKTGTHWDVSIPVTWRDVVLHLALLHDWSTSAMHKLNHPHWSVAVEWKIYLLFPLLCIARRKWGTARVAEVCVVASYGLWLVLHHFHWLNPSPWGSSVYYVGLFAMGMLAAELGETSGEQRRALVARLPGVLLAATCLLLVISVLGLLRPVLPLQLRSCLVGCYAAMLLLGLRLRCLPTWLSRPFETKIPTTLGRMSYSLYLIHAPLVPLTYLYLVEPFGWSRPRATLALVALCTPLCLLAGWVFHLAFEAPAHRVSRRLARAA